MHALVSKAAELVDRGMVTVPFPDARVLVRDTITAFQKFLIEPSRQYCSFDGELGYMRRDDDEHKSFFHFHPSLRELAHERDIGPAAHLCETAHLLYERCEHALLDFVKALDEVLPGYSLSLLANHSSSRKRNVLRLLQYDRADPNATIAKWHTDRSFLTLHVAESHPALRMRTARFLYRPAPETALVFPGDQVGRACPRLRALPHAAVEERSTDAERWAIVFFFQIHLGLLP